MRSSAPWFSLLVRNDRSRPVASPGCTIRLLRSPGQQFEVPEGHGETLGRPCVFDFRGFQADRCELSRPADLGAAVRISTTFAVALRAAPLQSGAGRRSDSARRAVAIGPVDW